MTKNHTNLPYRTNTQCIMVYNILCTKAQTVINNLDYCTNYYHNYFSKCSNLSSNKIEKFRTENVRFIPSDLQKTKDW